MYFTNPIVAFAMKREGHKTLNDFARAWEIPLETAEVWASSALAHHDVIFKMAEGIRDEAARRGEPKDVHSASVERYIPEARKAIANNKSILLEV